MGQARRSVRGKASRTHQRRAELPNLLRSGWPSRATLYNWIARGESEPQGRYGAFARAIARAEAVAVRRLHIRVAASNSQWILE